MQRETILKNCDVLLTSGVFGLIFSSDLHLSVMVAAAAGEAYHVAGNVKKLSG